ncbi:hypothetical protein BH10ACT1_BH10ACT1_40810 [soil metagenome]
MFGRRLHSVLVLVAFAAGLARLVQALRGDPTTTFSNHPSDTGRSVPDHLTLALAPVDTVEALPPDDGADPPIVPGTLFDPEPVLVPDPVPVPAPPAIATEPALTDSSPEPSELADGPPAPATWAAPVAGACPDGYPVKAKLKSGIFHSPGMSAYERTTPDRCYPDAASAEADGLRPAKR